MAGHIIYSLYITVQLFSIQYTRLREKRLHKKVKTRTIVSFRLLEQLFWEQLFGNFLIYASESVFVYI